MSFPRVSRKSKPETRKKEDSNMKRAKGLSMLRWHWQVRGCRTPREVPTGNPLHACNAMRIVVAKRTSFKERVSFIYLLLHVVQFKNLIFIIWWHESPFDNQLKSIVICHSNFLIIQCIRYFRNIKWKQTNNWLHLHYICI